MQLLSIVGLAIVAAVLCTVLRHCYPEYAAAVTLTDCGTREELADIVSVLYERATEALTAAEKGSVPVRSPELSKLSKTKLYRLCEVLNSFLLLDGANINVKLTQAQLSARIFEAVE